MILQKICTPEVMKYLRPLIFTYSHWWVTFGSAYFSISWMIIGDMASAHIMIICTIDIYSWRNSLRPLSLVWVTGVRVAKIIAPTISVYYMSKCSINILSRYFHLHNIILNILSGILYFQYLQCLVTAEDRFVLQSPSAPGSTTAGRSLYNQWN